MAGRGEGDRGPWSLVPCRGLGRVCGRTTFYSLALPPTASLSFGQWGLKWLFWCGHGIFDLYTVLLPQSSEAYLGISKFSVKIWASCSSPQDALSRQPNLVPLRSWEMDYFTQAFANDGSNLNLQVGVDGRNSEASVSIPLAPPSQHLLHTFHACRKFLLSFEFLSSLAFLRLHGTWKPRQG